MTGRVAAISALASFLVGMAFATFSELRLFLPALLTGSVVTIKVSVLAALVFFAAALVAGLGRASRLPPVRWISIIYIEIFRGTSLLVQLFWLFYVLPEFGILLSPMMAAVLGIGLNYGAYGAEIFRGSLAAVGRSQLEAATALNLSEFRRTVRIVLPQAIIIMIPGFSNMTIELVKATSIVSAVTLTDITYASVQQNQLYYRTGEIFLITIILYYSLTQILRFGANMLEAHVTRHLRPRIEGS